jgi:phage shock protein A
MKLKITGINFDFESDQFELLISKLNNLIDGKELIMATLDEVKRMVENANQKIDALNTAYDGYRALVESIQAEITALRATAHLNPVVQGKVDEIASLIGITVAKIDETYNENFPGTIPPVEPPPDEV